MTNKKKILLIDDEEDFCFFVKLSLENTGEFEVVATNRGKEGIELAQVEKPDLILLDITLPGIDGYEVCERVRSNPEFKDTKICFLTAMGREIDVAKGMALAADGYIVKPFSILDVNAKIAELLA